MTDPSGHTAAPVPDPPAPERDHVITRPASWVAACSDRGLKHHRNEDAVAVAADGQPGTRAVLVVCDGVSSSDHSDVASLAAACAVRDRLAVEIAQHTPGTGSRMAGLEAALTEAVEVGNAAVAATTPPDSAHPASCTIAVAVLDDDLVVFGTVGDSRVYWLPDADTADQPRQLSLDDSLAQLRVQMGVPREEAEHGPQAHAITRWLGRDSDDHAPATGALTVSAAGWVLVCSDGLWNYCSDPVDLRALVTAIGQADPLGLCQALVTWANDQGGHDNVTVALARHEPR